MCFSILLSKYISPTDLKGQNKQTIVVQSTQLAQEKAKQLRDKGCARYGKMNGRKLEFT